MNDEIYDKLNKVFREVFEDDSICVNENTTSADIEDWDSLEHVILLVEVEKAFGIKFSMNDVTHMNNVGEMVELIKKYLS